ncbi:MAG: LlaJI family restriction endonuclease [Oscillospiraceae bacterium]
MIAFHNNSVIFTKFAVRNNHLDTDNIISLIHEWCVFEAFEKFGWLWTNYAPRKPRVDCSKNRKWFISALQNKLNKTFNDKHKELFVACLAMLRHKRDEKNKGFYFGTTHFQTVWEGLIDSAFGTEIAKDYSPPFKWRSYPDGLFKKENELHPDSILKTNNDIFVLDAKYYGFILDKIRLPAASDINKQIVYGKFVFDKKRGSNESVYNAFLIPYNFQNNPYKQINVSDYPFACIGFASGWDKLGNETYAKILAILIDTKWLIQNTDKADKNSLSSFLVNSYNKIF